MNRETATVNKQTGERERINYKDGLQAYFEHSRGSDFIVAQCSQRQQKMVSVSPTQGQNYISDT